MGYSWHAKKVCDESLPLSYRLSHFRSCIQTYSYLSRQPYLSLLSQYEDEFHLDQSDVSENQLKQAFDRLERDRKAVLQKETEFIARRRAEKQSGKRTPAESELLPLSQLYAMNYAEKLELPKRERQKQLKPLIVIATKIVKKKVAILSGVLKVWSLWCEITEDHWADEDFRIFGIIDSDADNLLLSSDNVRADVLNSCKRIIDRFNKGNL